MYLCVCNSKKIQAKKEKNEEEVMLTKKGRKREKK